jgi:striatin 1/3/4
MPTTHIPPAITDEMPNSVYNGRQPSQQELQDAYVQLQQQKQQQQQQHRNNMSMVRENNIPNHQPLLSYEDREPQPLTRSNTQINHALPVREPPEGRLAEPGQTPITPEAAESRRALFSDLSLSSDESVESVNHSYDAYGREMPSNEVQQASSMVQEVKGDPTDAWDFDDSVPLEQPLIDAPPLRPDVDAFPSANLTTPKSPPRAPGSYRRKSSGARRRSDASNDERALAAAKTDSTQFKVCFAMRGHLDVVRSVIFTGGGSPAEPEFCTASDDGCIKRWFIPASYGNFPQQNNANDLDKTSHFTHRGHSGAVTSLAACPSDQNFAAGGRTHGDGWIFSGGQDACVKVWERGNVDAKATLEGHKDAVWALCVLPGNSGTILGEACSRHGGPDRRILVAGAADGTILIWAVSAPPPSQAAAGSNRGARANRRANSISAGSNFPSSPQPSIATGTPFHYSLVHQIVRADNPSPTCITPLGPNGASFVVSYTDASVLVFDSRTGEEVVGMASLETYDGTPNTGVNSIVASTTGFDTSMSIAPGRRGSMGEDDVVHGATGSDGGVEGVVIAGYEDRYIRFFDANSGT